MAALDTSCLTGVLGLASCECPCLTDIAPDGYNTSSSGLYITDLIPMSFLDGADNCHDPKNPWSALVRARAQGANMTLNDVRSGIMKRNQLTRPKYSGMIGENKSREVRTLSTTYAGVRVSGPRIKGGYMKLNSIGGVFNANGSISVQLYNRNNTAVGSPVVLTTVAGVHVSTACNIDLPLWIEGTPWPEYFLAYTVNSGNYPRDNRLWCTSCTRESFPVFSLEAPYYRSRKWSGASAWANWVMVSGWEGNNLTDFDLAAETATGEHFMNGLTMTVELYCDPVSSICLDGLDYSDPVALSLAHAYRYASAINMAQWLIRSPEVLRNAAIAKETLAVDIQNWAIDYQKNIEFVTFNAAVGNTDCVFCKPPYSMSIQSKTP